METDLLTLAIGSLSFLRPREKFSLAAAVRDEKDFLSLTLFDVEMAANRALRVRDFSPEIVLSKVERTKAYLDQKGIGTVSLLDEGYPALLKEIYDPPFLLFCRGERSSLGENLLAVVGTRQPTGRGLDAAYSLGFDAGSSGLGIVSGLARGIDAAAHRGNLEGGGRTVAILGCGIDRIYPLSNRDLGRQILETGGAVVSEYFPGTPPLTYHFPERNRIISGLSRCVVIVEAPAKSGALITADYALDQGRELYVHRAGLSGPASAGALSLSEDGARVVDSVAEVCADLRLSPPRGKSPRPQALCSSKDGMTLARSLLDELSGKSVSHRGLLYGRAEGEGLA